jgi:hypothetical protein
MLWLDKVSGQGQNHRMKSNVRLWKFHCEENKYPGLWQRWFRNQCVAVGWPSEKGYYLNRKTKGNPGWERARKQIQAMEIGDYVVVSLQGSRIGRVGKITDRHIADDEWDPLVPRSLDEPLGDKGRRILVRWDLTVGPNNQDWIVKLPDGNHFTPGEVRPTVSEIHSIKFKELCDLMKEPANWVSLFEFPYENALSDYIAAFPHQLEDGMITHPNKKVREFIFDDKKRADVLLMDRNQKTVIVECKKNSPTVENILQLSHYLKKYRRKYKERARGILVHGGARKLQDDFSRKALKAEVELVQFDVKVDFSKSE